MTTQELQNKEIEIKLYISSIVEGSQDFITEVFESMVENVKYTSCDDFLSFADERIDEMGLFDLFNRPTKESKLAAMMANAHQDEQYNSVTKQWEKI